MDAKEFQKLLKRGKLDKRGRLMLDFKEWDEVEGKSADNNTQPMAERTGGKTQPRLAEDGGRRADGEQPVAVRTEESDGDFMERLRAKANADAPKEKQHHVQHEEMMQMTIMNEVARILPENLSRLLVHNCNEFHGTRAQGGKRKSMGIRKGFPDLSFFYPTPYYHGLHIELKHGRNKQSPEQKEYEKLLVEQGYQYVVCKSVEDFIKGINQYILIGRWGVEK